MSYCENTKAHTIVSISLVRVKTEDLVLVAENTAPLPWPAWKLIRTIQLGIQQVKNCMVGTVASWLVCLSSRGPGSSPGCCHCIVFLCKTLYTLSASLHPGVEMGTGGFKSNPVPLPSILLTHSFYCFR